MAEYEFSAEQNTSIKTLYGKMGTVGLFTVLIGLLMLIVSVAGVASTYMGSTPKIPDNVAPDVKVKFTEAMAFVNANRSLTLYSSAGGALFAVILLAVGVYVRRASASFKAIVATEGNDITNLMNAVDSLKRTFSMFHTLLMLALVIGIAYAGYTMYLRFVVGT